MLTSPFRSVAISPARPLIHAAPAAACAGCPEAMLRRLADCLKKNGLPTRCPYGADALARAAMSDKKRAGGSITLVLPEAIGRCVLKKIPVSELPACFGKAIAVMEAMGL